MSALDNVFINTDKRLFYLSDDIGNETIGKICFNLLYLLKEDDDKEAKEKQFTREPIKIYINSYGGFVHDMWALIDIIENSKTPIHTYCTGYAMSAAFKIFISGHKRFASRHATFMYHNINCCEYGKYQDVVEQREEIDYVNSQVEEYVMERTKLTKEFILEAREKKQDMYIHADKVLELGIADELI